MAGLHRVRHIARLLFDGGWAMAEHSHPFQELVLVADGEIETVMDGRTTRAGAGMVKFHPQGIAHAERAVGGRPPVLLCMCWDEGAGVDCARWPQLTRCQSTKGWSPRTRGVSTTAGSPR